MNAFSSKTIECGGIGGKILSVLMTVALAMTMVATGLFSAPSAQAAAPQTGNLEVKNVMDGEQFKAVRFVDTIAGNNEVRHSFSDGITFGNGGDDNGLSEFAALRGSEDISEALKSVESQLTEDHATYLATAQNGTARFENLPLGQYLVTAVNPNPTRTYSYMLGNVYPTFSKEDNMWSMQDPMTLFGKYIDVTVPPEKTPVIHIDKQVIPEEFDDVNAKIDYTVKINFDNAEKIQFLHVDDDLAADAIQEKYAINEDVKICYEGETTPIHTAKITYKYVDSRSIGYAIDVPEVDATRVLVITYTGNAKELTKACELDNVVSAYAASVGTVDDNAKTKYKPKDEVIPPTPPANEEEIPDNGTPLDVIASFFQQTGDSGILLCGIVGVAVVAAIVLVIVRKRNKKKEE